MPGSITIRAGGKSDREWCARLMASSQPWIRLRRKLQACRAVLARPWNELFIARAGRRRLGFFLSAPYGLAGSPYISSIAVERDKRSRGVGAELMAFAERRYAGRRHLFLCVSSFNRRAQVFYRRLGYERVGELKDYIVAGHSEFLLYKTLP